MIDESVGIRAVYTQFALGPSPMPLAPTVASVSLPGW